ncbi:hypothetical protein EMIHUDRAFT_239923 [Emiliania huxleyi CCMP1516]|uniref:Uncharacterized protein n=2 Tax=Emiliania huxleyi TaxID=2903 RepID=A0A0D3JI93_EMIH1|nr:hypothetical protein EMIHUDRAFT_239923 [Emiliania huxleyi CCMP1516]EOD23228.1 hypothetical protein EMIHUDRAFT_239923 [Emiliania huxleyi CCMP1516]|eukprot:XP_005775657.1 hypothetical protein EMIHUDRAFT_239923 [Emiliania huxleyi CCMP1516]
MEAVRQRQRVCSAAIAYQRSLAPRWLPCSLRLGSGGARGASEGTQHQRLGNHCLNSANATHRHNAALAAVHRALTSVTSDALPVGSIQLADKGDGTPASKAERRGYYAHVNKGHIPDLIRFGSTTTCWEFKCYTPFLPSGAKGNGSARCGGAASRADGHFIALGNTEEHLSVVVLGHPQRGDPDTEEQLDRVSGDGWVAAKDGDYADALTKGHTVILLVTESTGAFSADLDRVLRQLARTARASGSIDHTPVCDEYQAEATDSGIPRLRPAPMQTGRGAGRAPCYSSLFFPSGRNSRDVEVLQCRTRMLASGCVAITLVAIFASLAIPYLSGAFRIACVSPCYVLVLGASQANASPKWLRNSTCIALVPILPVLIDYICRVEAVDIDLGEDDKDTWLEEQLEDDLEEHAVNHTDLHLLEASMLADLLLICGSFVLAEASQRLARERLGSAGAQPAWISSPFGFRSVSTSSSERLSDRASDDDGAAASRSSPATLAERDGARGLRDSPSRRDTTSGAG